MRRRRGLKPLTGAPAYSFVDEFTGSVLDLTKWKREAPTYAAGIGTWSTATDLVTLNGSGQCVVSAIKRASGAWEGGMISTGDLFRMKAGVCEIRAQLSTLTGAWPAIWFINNMYGTGQGNYAEIDIMELFPGGGSKGPGAYFTIHDWSHNDDRGANLSPNAGAADGGYHVWRLVWDPTRLELFIDGVSQGSFTPATFAAATSPAGSWVFSDIGLQLVLNQAPGTTWGGPAPAAGVSRIDMLVDYVRITKVA